MIRVAICDDEPLVLDKMKRFFEDSEIEVYLFSSGQTLLDSQISFDIVLLDIQMPEQNGLVIASELYNRNRSTLLIFITNYLEYSLRGYEYRAFRYILKSEPDEFIKRNIQDAIKECKNINHYLTITYKNEIFKISSMRISYIESYGHTLVIHTVDGDYCCQDKLKAIYNYLYLYGFIQCHKSYLVNMRYVQSVIKNNYIVLDDHIQIPIGRKYSSDVIDTYLKYEDRRM